MALHLRMAVSRILTRFLYEARLPWPWFQDMFPGAFTLLLRVVCGNASNSLASYPQLLPT